VTFMPRRRATGDGLRAALDGKTTVPEFLRWTPKSRHGPLSPFYLQSLRKRTGLCQKP
jgi:hypothetical protein